MRLELTGRHIDITPTLRALVQRAVAPVLRRLNDSAVSAQVVVTRQKVRVHAEVTLHARGVHFLHAEATGVDAARAVGAATDKLERQADKLKDKRNHRKGGRRVSEGLAVELERPAQPRAATGTAATGTAAAGTAGSGRRIIRRRPAIKRMSIEDASAMLGDDGVIVFRNRSTDALSILFRRPDGNLGLIEPEA